MPKRQKGIVNFMKAPAFGRAPRTDQRPRLRLRKMRQAVSCGGKSTAAWFRSVKGIFTARPDKSPQIPKNSPFTSP
jgi:hypothetical protein